MGSGWGPGAVVGVGVDVVELDRIARAWERHGSRFLERLFCPEEIGYCMSKTRRARVACLAARFAAKEAVMKALGTGRRGVGFSEIGVVRGHGGRPGVALAGRAARVAQSLGIDEICLSITHGRDVAVAVALAVSRRQGGGTR